MSKQTVLFFVIPFLVSVCLSSIQVASAESRTIVVPDDYDSIQEALDNALYGDRIVVRSGTYNGSIWINKTISLVGENSARIIGDYRLNGTVILVTSDNVNITGFTVEPSPPSASRRGVHLLYVNHCNIYNNIFINNNIGVWLFGSSDNIITGNSVVGLGDIGNSGVKVQGSNHNSIENNILEDNYYGISIVSSSHNNVTNNKINYKVKNFSSTGIMIEADENQLIDNVIECQTVGLSLHGSNNILRNNKFSNNTTNFKIYTGDTSNFFNDVDASNTIDGNPIIYWVDVQNKKVPDNAAFVCLVRCVNVTVENLKLQGNYVGIILALTTNSSVTNNLIHANHYGVFVYQSFDNIISQNRLENCDCGICLTRSSRNTLNNNTISDCSPSLILDASAENLVKGNIIIGDFREGIKLQDSQKNNITENAIVNCKRRALVFWPNSSGNLFYRNNFINNTKNIEEMYSEWDIDHHDNSWDNGTVGNYWSDYVGTDANNDDVGDTPYVIDDNNQDNYPLMQPLVISPSSGPEPSPSQEQTGFKFPTAEVAISIAIISIALVTVYYLKRKPKTKKE